MNGLGSNKTFALGAKQVINFPSFGYCESSMDIFVKESDSRSTVSNSSSLSQVLTRQGPPSQYIEQCGLRLFSGVCFGDSSGSLEVAG